MEGLLLCRNLHRVHGAKVSGHTVADGKIYQKRFLDFKKDIEEEMAKLDFLNDPEAFSKQEELKAMSICCDAVITFGRRHAERAMELAAQGRMILEKALLRDSRGMH